MSSSTKKSTRIGVSLAPMLETQNPRVGFKYHFILDNLEHLLGQVLTVVDATTPDKVQCKAVKDLMREAFRHKQDWFREVGFDGHKLHHFPNDGLIEYVERGDALVPPASSLPLSTPVPLQEN